MASTRRVAAILAADIVGYSRLMGLDEAGTAQAVREHRAAADPLIARPTYVGAVLPQPRGRRPRPRRPAQGRGAGGVRAACLIGNARRSLFV
jgi:hypothetical protein